MKRTQFKIQVRSLKERERKMSQSHSHALQGLINIYFCIDKLRLMI